MDVRTLANCVRDYVATWALPLEPEAWARVLAAPNDAFRRHAESFERVLQAQGMTFEELSAHVRDEPFLYLQSAFPVGPLPDTPTAWVPIPDVEMTRGALAAALLIVGACGMESISYGSENGGALFVNLVPLPGKGALVEKSQGRMRGHTDAATFPFRGTLDPDYPRIAPSPDVVVLAGLRNPDQIPTVVRPLELILDALSREDIEILQGPNFVIGAQKTFVQGTEKILGERHVLDGAAVLWEGPEGTWVRYSHGQSTVFDVNSNASKQAKEHFEAACEHSECAVALAPGDLVLVNNRKALHGRAPVGKLVGGQARWLIRSYGLDCSQVTDEQRYEQSFKLYP